MIPAPDTNAPRAYRNPVTDRYFADPFVFRHEGVYYALGTEPPWLTPDSGRVFPMLRSEDFVTWEPIPHALVRPDPALGTSFWAPEVAYEGGTFYLYYSVGFEDKNHQLRVATSDQPGGPYRDIGEPVLDPAVCPFAIDPHPFRDDDGHWYLFYARDFLDTEEGYRAGTALVVEPLQGMMRVAGDARPALRATHDWQRFMSDRSMYDGVYDWHTLEGPCCLKHEGRYYLLYSGGRWENDTYGMDFGVADHPLGPFTGAAPDAAHARVARTVPGVVLGPGHNSAVLGPDGVTPYVVYHAWDPQMTARRMCLDRLEWTPEGPRLAGPTWTPQAV